jgi:hypothetical protein
MDLQTVMAAKLARMDVPRDEAKVRVRVVSTADGVVECGLVIQAGDNELLVYASDITKLEALVETDEEAMHAAERDHRIHLAEIEEKRRARGGDGKDVELDTERAYRPSLAASFRQVNRRNMKPFKSVQRLDDKPAKRAA